MEYVCMKALVPSGMKLVKSPEYSKVAKFESFDWETHIGPAILPPVPFSTARCTPDSTGGVNRRLSCLRGFF